MKRLSVYVLCLCIAVLPGGQAMRMTDEQQDAAVRSVEAEYRAKRITRKQRDAAIEMLEDANSSTGIDWGLIMQSGVNVLMAVLLGTPIAAVVTTRRVMKIRGPVATPDERVARLERSKK